MFRKIIFLIIFTIFSTDCILANNKKNLKPQNNQNNQIKSENLYIIKNIQASYKSTDAKKAKEEAIKIAERKALKELFKKGGLNADYTRFIDDSTIFEMVETIKIADEVITKQSYSSTLTIVFNKEFINFNLKKLGIGRNLVKDAVYLYIPLFENENGKVNFLEDDIWYRSAYENFFSNNYQNIFIIDNYSLSNAGLLSVNAINNADYNKLKSLLTKYESNTVVIALASYNSVDDVVEINFKEIDAENINERLLNFSNKEDLEKDELIREASIKALEFLNNESQLKMSEARNDKKKLNKLKKNNFIDVYFTIPNFREYVYVKNLINNLNFINKYEILLLTTKFVKLRLFYKCDESEIIALFSNNGFVLQNKNGNYYLNYKGF